MPSVIGELYFDVNRGLEGWCSYPDQPGTRATVELLRNGEVVRASRATHLRDELHDHMGDRHCGFWFPLPAGIVMDGPRIVLEARERRLGTIFGRIVLGNNAQAMERLDAVAATQRVTADALANPNFDIAAILGALGHTLMHLSSRPPKQRKLGLPGLQACLEQIADIPPADFGWCSNPRLTLVVPATGNLKALAARLSYAARLLHRIDLEILLLDDGADPLVALLPTRLRGLVLIHTYSLAGLGGLLNAAVMTARGKVLAFARPGGPGLANLLEAIDLAPGTIGFDSRLISSPTVETTQNHLLQCLVYRSDVAAMGGFDPIEEGDALWNDLLGKAAAMGLVVTTWSAPQSARIPGKRL